MLEKAVDGPSYRGQFGWEQVGTSDLAVPVIVRTNGVRYAPVKIVEQEIIKKYESLPPSVFGCITLKSFYLTAMEAKLLNEINYNHCNNRYGETYFCVKDVIISASDVKELSRYLNISHEVFCKDMAKVGPHFGVVELVVDPMDPGRTMLAPFVTKVHNGQLRRFVSFKVAESFAKASSTSVFSPPSDWDVMYLKMLSAYCNLELMPLITKEGHLTLLDGLIYKKNNNRLSYTDCNSINDRDGSNTNPAS